VGELSGERADRAERPLDENGLAGDRAVAEDRAVRGGAGNPEAGARLVVDLVGQLDSLVSRHDGQLRGSSQGTVRLRPVDPLS
jgi:hypothetical protein